MSCSNLEHLRFLQVVRRHKLGEEESEYKSEKLVLFAPAKNFHNWSTFDKILTKKISLHSFYRAMHFSAYARSWDRMSSVRSSVRLSVRL